MRCLVLIVVVLAMAAARPEMYREKEDFQYSRSSSDEGSKSGFYGAQRGNMGGNYERAHNMDSLAQHQMSGLVHQVDGELGDASNTKTGSVYTAANSRGIYGSGNYDLGNLEGRNFEEGTSYGNSHSQSALTNSAYRDHSSNENRYRNSNSYSHSSRHSNSERSEYEQHEGAQSSNLRSGENAYQHEYGVYDGSSRLSHSASPYQNRLVSTRPMKILVRPGTRVTVPLATQTYDADHSASSYNADHSASSYNADHRASSYNADHSASSYDSSLYNQHAAKSDAELIENSANENHNKQVPINKHYESSYNYHKEWEKHDDRPGAVPLGIDENSIPKTSELYDDSQHSQAYNNRNQQYASKTAGSHNSHLSNSYGYNSKSNLASSSHSRQQSEYDLQREKLNADLNAFTSNAHQRNLDANQQRTMNLKPKSYESSYSYHKSWERQGDPYVIEPGSNGQNSQSSQRLTDSHSHNNGYSSHQYGSNHKSSHQSYSSSNALMDCDCDDEGHIRVARSYNTDQEVQQQQNGWEVDDQQTQNQDLGQHTQNKWDKIEDLGQQSQNQWDNIQDLGQQTQNKWDKYEDFGQQTQNRWDKIEDLGQQTQNQWDNINDFGQQSQNKWDKPEDLTQTDNHAQQTQNQLNKIEDLGQQTQYQNNVDKNEDLGQQQSQNQWDKIEDLGQQAQSKWDNIEDAGQQSQNQWDKEEFNQHSWGNQNLLDQQSQSSVDQDLDTWRNIENSHKQSDTNNYESQEASVSAFEDKNTNIFPSQNIFKDTSTTTNSPQNPEHLYDNENKHFWNSEQSLFKTYTNTFSNGENYDTDKQSSLDKEQTALQNNYLHQQVTENTLSEERTQHSSSINNLWDKLDRLDRESLNKYYNPNKVNQSEEQPSPTEKSEDFDKTPKHPQDIGRGDIETENTSFEIKTNFEMQNEALSLSTNQNNVTHTQHNNSDKKHIDISLESVHPTSDDFNNTYNKINYTDEKYSDRKNHPENINLDIHQDHYQEDYQYLNKETDHKDFDQHSNQNDLIYTKPDENDDQQSMHHHFDSFYQQNENLNQQSMHPGSPYFDDINDNFGQHNLNQNLEDFGYLNGNLDQRNMQHTQFQYTDNNNMHQNIDKLDKSTWDQQQFDQGFYEKNFEQENMEKYLQSFDKYKDNFDQKASNEQLVDFSKLNDNFDQQSVNHAFETFNQQNENIDQHNIEQNLQNFDKSSDNLVQDNLDQNLVGFSNINDDQQSFNKHYDNFQQKSDNAEEFGRNNNFGQHNTNQNFDYEKQNEKFEVEIPRENFDQQNEDNPNIAQEIPFSSQNAAQSNSQNSVTNYEDKKYDTHKSFSQQSAHTTVAPPPEQTGFWASVGKKFSKAKDKVTSWFRKTSE